MTLAEFEDALDQFGADLDDWPSERAAAARALLDTSGAVLEAFALAKRLDQGLDALLATPIAAPTGLADRILARATPPAPEAEVYQFPARAIPPTATVETRRVPRFWHPDRPAMIAAAMLVVCFIGGVITVRTVSPADTGHESVYISAIYSDLAR